MLSLFGPCLRCVAHEASNLGFGHVRHDSGDTQGVVIDLRELQEQSMDSMILTLEEFYSFFFFFFSDQKNQAYESVA